MMSKEKVNPEILIEQQKDRLKNLGLEAVDYVGVMPVIEGVAFLEDSRLPKSKYAEVNVRFVLGNDIDLPRPIDLLSIKSRYPGTDERLSVYAFCDMFQVALARTVQYVMHYESKNGALRKGMQVLREFIDTSNSSKEKGLLAPPITIIFSEGRASGEGNKHLIVPNPSESYDTEVLLRTLNEKYYQDYPLKPFFLLAACNLSKDDRHSVTIQGPEKVNLAYVKGLASIWDAGELVVNWAEEIK